MAKTKRFKQTDIGPIPEDWEVKRLGDVVEINPRSELALPERFIYVDLECVSTGKLLVRNLIDRSSAPSRAQRRFYNGDVLFQTVRPYQKNNLYVCFDASNYVASTGYAVLHSKLNGAETHYVYYQIHDSRFNSAVLDACTGTSYPAIKPMPLADVVLPLPTSTDEQRRIAAALGDVDSLLATYDALIEKKRKIKVGAMQELLGIRNDELGMRNEPRRRLPGFTGAWVEKGFDECFSLLSNNTYAREFMCADETGVANIHYGDVLIRYGSVLDFSTTHVDSLQLSVLIKSESLKDGDLIFADTAEDEMVGKAVEVRNLNDRRAVSGLHTVACRPKFEFAEGWLGYYINSPDYHNQLLPLITGTKVSSVSKAGFRQTVLHFPPTLAEQRAIAGVLSDMDAEIAELEREREKTRRIREGMMQELLTGRVRLEVA